MSQTITIHFIKNDKTLTNKPEPGTRPVIKVTINPSSGDDHCISINEKKKASSPLWIPGLMIFMLMRSL